MNDQNTHTLLISIERYLFIVLVPEQCSDEMRLVIHALLVAYGEPKLNIMTDSIDLSLYSHDENNYWCQHLIHPRRYSSSIQ